MSTSPPSGLKETARRPIKELLLLSVVRTVATQPFSLCIEASAAGSPQRSQRRGSELSMQRPVQLPAQQAAKAASA